MKVSRKQLEKFAAAAFKRGRFSVLRTMDVDVQAGFVAKSATYDEHLHPRDSNGRFVKKADIEAAKTDPAKANELRAKVTNPEERAKLETQLKAPATPGGGDGESNHAKPKAEKPAGKVRPKVSETVDAIRAAQESGFHPEMRLQLADAMQGHTVDELNEIQRQLGLVASGRKSEVINRMVLQAVGIETPERGFSGKLYDRYGHLLVYQGGVKVARIKNPSAEQAVGARPRISVETAHAMIDAHVKNGTLGTPEGREEIGTALQYQMTTREIAELKRRLNVSASGRKHALAEKINNLLTDKESAQLADPAHPLNQADPSGWHDSLLAKNRFELHNKSTANPDRQRAIEDAADRLKLALKSPRSAVSVDGAKGEVRAAMNDLVGTDEMHAAVALARGRNDHPGEAGFMNWLATAVHKRAIADAGKSAETSAKPAAEKTPAEKIADASQPVSDLNHVYEVHAPGGIRNPEILDAGGKFNRIGKYFTIDEEGKKKLEGLDGVQIHPIGHAVRSIAERIKQRHELASGTDVEYGRMGRDAANGRLVDQKLRIKAAADMKSYLQRHPELRGEFGKYESHEPSRENVAPPTAAEHLAKYGPDASASKIIADYENAGGRAFDLVNHLDPSASAEGGFRGSNGRRLASNEIAARSEANWLIQQHLAGKNQTGGGGGGASPVGESVAPAAATSVAAPAPVESPASAAAAAEQPAAAPVVSPAVADHPLLIESHNLDKQVKDATDALLKVPGYGSGKMGLTPDEVKARSDYREAKNALDNAMVSRRNWNTKNAKTLADETTREQRMSFSKRMASEQNNQAEQSVANAEPIKPAAPSPADHLAKYTKKTAPYDVVHHFVKDGGNPVDLIKHLDPEHPLTKHTYDSSQGRSEPIDIRHNDTLSRAEAASLVDEHFNGRAPGVLPRSERRRLENEEIAAKKLKIKEQHLRDIYGKDYNAEIAAEHGLPYTEGKADSVSKTGAGSLQNATVEEPKAEAVSPASEATPDVSASAQSDSPAASGGSKELTQDETEQLLGLQGARQYQTDKRSIAAIEDRIKQRWPAGVNDFLDKTKNLNHNDKNNGLSPAHNGMLGDHRKVSARIKAQEKRLASLKAADDKPVDAVASTAPAEQPQAEPIQPVADAAPVAEQQAEDKPALPDLKHSLSVATEQHNTFKRQGERLDMRQSIEQLRAKRDAAAVKVAKAEEIVRHVGSRQPEKRNAVKELNALKRDHQALADTLSSTETSWKARDARLEDMAADESQPDFVRLAAAANTRTNRLPHEQVRAEVTAHVADHLAKNGKDPAMAEMVTDKLLAQPLTNLDKHIDSAVADKKVSDDKRDALEFVKNLPLARHNQINAENEIVQIGTVGSSFSYGGLEKFKERWEQTSKYDAKQLAEKQETERKAKAAAEADAGHEAESERHLDNLRAGKPGGDISPEAMQKVVAKLHNQDTVWRPGVDLPKGMTGKKQIESIAKDVSTRWTFPKTVTEHAWATNGKYAVKATPEMVEHAKSLGHDKIEGRAPDITSILPKMSDTVPAKIVGQKLRDETGGHHSVLIESENGNHVVVDADLIARVKSVYPNAEIRLRDDDKHHTMAIFAQDGKPVGLAMGFGNYGGDNPKPELDHSPAISMESALKKGKFTEKDAEESQNGMMVGHGTDDVAGIRITGKKDSGFSLEGYGPKVYKTKAQAQRAARELLAYTHGSHEPGKPRFIPASGEVKESAGAESPAGGEVSPVAEPVASAEPAAPVDNSHAEHMATQAKLSDLRSKIDEYRQKVASNSGSKSDLYTNRNYLFRLEQEHDAIAGLGASGRTLADNERDTELAKKEEAKGDNYASEKLKTLDAERSKFHSKFVDDHLSKLDKRIAKLDDANTWANHVLKNHGPVKWDSEMETVYSNPKDAHENGFPKRLLADEKKGQKGQPIDQIAQTMEKSGELIVPPDRNATDYLIEKLSGGETFDGTHDDKRQELAQERDDIGRMRDGKPGTDSGIVDAIRQGRKKTAVSAPQDSIPDDTAAPAAAHAASPAVESPAEPAKPQLSGMAHAAAAMNQLAANSKTNETAENPISSESLQHTPGEYGDIRETSVGKAKLVYRTTPDGAIELSSVRVPAQHRGQGEARSAMSYLIKAADAAGKPIKLISSPLDSKTNAGKLASFYKSLGFEPTRVVNPAGDWEMVRKPNAGNQVGDIVEGPTKEQEAQSGADPRVVRRSLEDKLRFLAAQYLGSQAGSEERTLLNREIKEAREQLKAAGG